MPAGKTLHRVSSYVFRGLVAALCLLMGLNGPHTVRYIVLAALGGMVALDSLVPSRRRMVRYASVLVGGALVVYGVAGAVQASPTPPNLRSDWGRTIASGDFGDGTTYRVGGARVGEGRNASLGIRITTDGKDDGAFSLTKGGHGALRAGGVRSCTSSGQYVVVAALLRAGAAQRIIVWGNGGHREAMRMRRLDGSLRIRGWVFAYATLSWPPRRVVADSRGGVVHGQAGLWGSGEERCVPGQGGTVGAV